MRSKQDKFLDQQVHVLSERIRQLLLQCRPRARAIIANPTREGKIVLWIWYPYDEKLHKGRPFTIDDEERRLERLKVSEANILGGIVASIVESDFDAELVRFKDGKIEYSLTPRRQA